MLNFYGKFMPDLATTLEPLHVLLRKDTCWKWGTEQQEAFEKTKNRLQSSDVLVHYYPKKELFVCCDASPYGIGAVHGPCYGRWLRETSCICLTNTLDSEKELWPLDKETLAVVFAVKKSHQFLFARHFKIYTDHKLLLGPLNP